ncbi:5716_t:CDS:1 [Gigaspora margarita]|uniref:5716_t:CDS:1 n=1 Tax=Gigaspora margarita TaxID=4874 RepID=A0ABN7V2V4_GIGMA|nr:5716_t:CDS:1 [Gigaspora margarita]
MALVPKIDGYLFNYNLCTETVNGVTKSNAIIGPNNVCLENAPKCGSYWQNGIFGMEMSHITVVEVATAAENIYKGKTYWTVIKELMNLAGFNSGSNVYKTLLECFPNNKSVPATGLSMKCANLVKLWLVRNHLVGLSVAISDNLACLNSSSNYPSWFMNNIKFSNGFEGIKNTINILANYYTN